MAVHGRPTAVQAYMAPPQELYDFAEENKEWLRVFQLPSYAPELNPQEGVWSLMRRAMVNFVAADLTALVRIMKRKLKKIQYRPELIDGCLVGTGLTLTLGPELITQPAPTRSI